MHEPQAVSPSPTSPPWKFTPSRIELLCLIIGLVLVYCYAWLMDDSYVYFRYVDNFVIHGKGLVWNPGEYVEGFSSPAWAALLITLRGLHMHFWIAVWAVGLVCFGLFWWLCCVVHRGFLSEAESTAAPLNIPLIYLSCTYAVACYFTSGLEAPLVAVTAAVFAAAVLWPTQPLLQIVVGLSPLIRQELMIPFVLFMGYAWWCKRIVALVAAGTFLASVGGYTLFRIWYYADLLPNTFYLKDMTWIKQGLLYLWDTLSPYHTLPILGVMLLLFIALKRARTPNLRTQERLALLIFALPVVLYVIKIGGDPRHFRYLAFPFILIVLATGGLVERALAVIPSRRTTQITLAVTLLFTVTCLSNFPRQLDHHPIFRMPLLVPNPQVNLIGDSAAHRMRSNQLTPPWHAPESPSFVALSYTDAVRRFNEESTNKRLLPTAPLGEKVPGPHMRAGQTLGGLPITSDSWCQNGYLHQAIPIIHNLGLTEPFLARTKMRSDRPAHKYGLRPIAHDIMRIRGRYGFGRGVFDQVLAESKNPQRWIVKNIDSLRIIENKVYNKHNFIENLRLALTPVAKISP